MSAVDVDFKKKKEDIKRRKERESKIGPLKQKDKKLFSKIRNAIKKQK